MNRLALVFLAVVLVACEAETTRPPATPVKWATDVDVAWAEMNRALQGNWQAKTESGRVIETSYRTVSKGSALVETFKTASGTETITVYHRDGNTLMLTHYCAQGNQARLKATSATRDKIVFEFLDDTNERADQGVMQKLIVTLRPDGFDQESVYRESGKLEATTLRFQRVTDR